MIYSRLGVPSIGCNCYICIYIYMNDGDASCNKQIKCNVCTTYDNYIYICDILSYTHSSHFRNRVNCLDCCLTPHDCWSRPGILWQGDGIRNTTLTWICLGQNLVQLVLSRENGFHMLFFTDFQSFTVLQINIFVHGKHILKVTQASTFKSVGGRTWSLEW